MTLSMFSLRFHLHEKNAPLAICLSILKVYLTFAALLIFVSCKKGNTDQPVSNSPKIKTYIETISGAYQNSSDTFSISYDNNNRMTSAITPTGNQFLYAYNTPKDYTLDIKNGNHTVIHEIFFLNADLLTDSTFQYNDTNDSSTEKYFYDQTKQLLSYKQYAYSKKNGSILQYSEEYTYDNGNLVKTTRKNETGNISYYTTYTYTTLSAPVFTLASFYQQTSYRNLPASMSTYHPGYGTVSYNFTYTFDNMNRMTSQTMANANTTVVHKYIY